MQPLAECYECYVILGRDRKFLRWWKHLWTPCLSISARVRRLEVVSCHLNKAGLPLSSQGSMNVSGAEGPRASSGIWCNAWAWHLEICRSDIYGYGSIPINTIFSGMNIHLPAILTFTRGTRFWPIPISSYTIIYDNAWSDWDNRVPVEVFWATGIHGVTSCGLEP